MGPFQEHLFFKLYIFFYSDNVTISGVFILQSCILIVLLAAQNHLFSYFILFYSGANPIGRVSFEPRVNQVSGAFIL